MEEKNVKLPQDSTIRRLEFALVRAISALELVETNAGQVMSFKRLIKELKAELRKGVEDERQPGA